MDVAYVMAIRLASLVNEPIEVAEKHFTDRRWSVVQAPRVRRGVT